MKTCAPVLIILLAALGVSGCAGALVGAAGDGDITRIDEFLSKGADVNKREGLADCNTPLMAAALNGQDAAVKHLIERGAELNPVYRPMSLPEMTGVYTPLYCAAVGQKPETVKLLLASGAKLTAPTMKALRENPGRTSPEMLADIHAAANGRPRAGAAAAVAAPPPAAKPAVVSDVDTPSRRAAERPDDFALVVGIEDYQTVPKADYGVRDAQAVRKQLSAMGVPDRNIISLEGQSATNSKLRGYLEEWLPLNVKPVSTLFVYYSGHGAPDTKDGDTYLVPWDGDPRFLKTTAYPLKKFYADLARIKAKRIIVALDACFSGAGGRSVLPKGARPLVSKVDIGIPPSENLTVLAAAAGDEITGSLDDQGHGAFTYYLLKGLSGGAAGADGTVSARSLYDYLKPRVEDAACRDNRIQTPSLFGGTGEVPLAVYR